MTSEIKADQSALVNELDFQALAREKMRTAIRFSLVTVLEEEVSAFIGAERYERNGTRRDQRNGSYPRDLGTSVGRLQVLAVPRTRKRFRTQLLERDHRRQAELDAAIGDMFVYGASTPRVGEVMETLTGENPVRLRSRGSSIRWMASLKPGKNAPWLLIIGTSFWMVPTLPSSMTTRATKCRFWPPWASL
jgi:transposase-like protein